MESITISQIGQYISQSSASPIDSITGNVGGPVGPDVTGDILLVGSGNILVTGNPATNTLTFTFDGVLPIANGGTAASSYSTNFGTLYYDGIDFNTTATGSLNQVLMSNGPGLAPSYQSMATGGAVTSVNAGNSISITGTATAPIVNVAGTVDHTVQLGNATGSLSSLPNGLTGQTLHAVTGANDPIWSTVSLTADVAGTLPVGNGGTGNTTFTPFAVLTAGTVATGPFQNVVGLGAAGTVLTSAGPGALPVWLTDSSAGASTFNTGSGVATAAGNAITIAGGSNITTTGAASTVTINLATSPSVSGSITAGTGLIATAGGITATGTSAINTSGAGTTSIGTGTNTGTISIGNTSSGAVNIDSGTAGINIGATANAHATVLGSTTGASSTAIRYGTADFTLASATGTVMSALDTGEITMPLQPAFLARHNVLQSDVTGAGLVATINFTSETFDQNGDYDGINTFTAPVTGRYQLNATVRLAEVTAAETSTQWVILTSSGTNTGALFRSFPITITGGIVSQSWGLLSNMDAGDTAVVQVTVSGMAGNTVDIGTIASQNYFSGYLVA